LPNPTATLFGAPAVVGALVYAVDLQRTKGLEEERKQKSYHVQQE